MALLSAPAAARHTLLACSSSLVLLLMVPGFFMAAPPVRDIPVLFTPFLSFLPGSFPYSLRAGHIPGRLGWETQKL